jgi:hypothetical protein
VTLHLWVRSPSGGGDPVLEKGEGEFHAEELVVLAGEALSLEVAAVGDEEGGGIRAEVHADAVGDDPAGALEVEADFDAGGMKAVGPVQVGRRLGLVPFEAEAVAGEAAGQLAPNGARTLPEERLVAEQGPGDGLRRDRGGWFKRGHANKQRKVP